VQALKVVSSAFRRRDNVKSETGGVDHWRAGNAKLTQYVVAVCNIGGRDGGFAGADQIYLPENGAARTVRVKGVYRIVLSSDYNRVVVDASNR